MGWLQYIFFVLMFPATFVLLADALIMSYCVVHSIRIKPSYLVEVGMCMVILSVGGLLLKWEHWMNLTTFDAVCEALSDDGLCSDLQDHTTDEERRRGTLTLLPPSDMTAVEFADWLIAKKATWVRVNFEKVRFDNPHVVTRLGAPITEPAATLRKPVGIYKEY